MTRTHIIEAESATFLLIAAIVGVLLAYYTHYKPNIKTSLALPVLTPLATPTPAPSFVPLVTTFSQISPDGTKKVEMTVTTEKNSNKTYLFTVSDIKGDNPQTIFKISLPSSESMSIPYNTFSPNDTYVFLTHTVNNANEAWIFQTTGKPLGENLYDNATSIFKTKISSTVTQVATGWASDTLLIIDTYQPDGTEGTSYWFEVPSAAIIPLATKF